MANRQTFPSSLFPLQGDISAEAGNILVRVQGIQFIPVTTDAPADGSVLTYVLADNEIEWKTSGGNNAVQINAVGVSADKQIFINAVTDGSAPTWVIKINGVLDGG